jgi:hypothetical protein
VKLFIDVWVTIEKKSINFSFIKLTIVYINEARKTNDKRESCTVYAHHSPVFPLGDGSWNA